MRFDLPFHRLSLRARLISNYLVVLGIGGLVTSIVGSWIVSTTIMAQARRAVDRDLGIARTLYDQQLETVESVVRLTASGTTIQQYVAAGDEKSLFSYLDALRTTSGFDFLTLTDGAGRVVVRVSQPTQIKDTVSNISVVKAALAGEVAAATEVLSAEALGREDPDLCRRAYIRFVPTPKAKPLQKRDESAGMVLVAAAPVRGADADIRGVLYGGILLNRNLRIVDRVWEIVFKGDLFEGRDVGTVTIFQDDVRITTTVKTGSGERAIGTRVSAEVNDALLGRGETWKTRAFVVDDWYISGYEPISNHEGDTIGILYVGLLEQAYTSIRDRVILSFFGIAMSGFILIILITYYEIGSITRPIREMVAATRRIAAGEFDQELRASSFAELALLSESFNTMLKSLSQMKGDLEDWGKTLEEKVKLRSKELLAMHVRVAHSERLASIGKLAAGVAHEINNPLGGILALSALSLEDMKPEDPNRENLEEVLRQTERCRDIVRSLLDFSRQSEANTELVDVNQILQGTLALLSKQALFFNINVVRNLYQKLPSVLADKSQIQQVFMNIIMNAVQAMEEKGTVTVVTRLNPADQHIEILISDTGRGIPSEKIDRIFDPFFTTKASGKGTGLGLSIAYGIVTEHNGTISVQSEVGRGSTFMIRLPSAPTTAEQTQS